MYVPVWVRMWRLSRLGRSKALPHTSHGSSVRSPRGGRVLGETCGSLRGSRSRSPAVEAPEDADDSPDSDLRSSVSREGGEDAVEGEEMSARESSDIERSRGESVRENITVSSWRLT